MISKYDPNNNKFSKANSGNKILKAKLFAYEEAVNLLLLIGFLPDEENIIYQNNLKPD